MSGLELLLRTARDYELTHQLILYSLFENSPLPALLAGVGWAGRAEMEPERGTFDLGTWGCCGRLFFEIKVRATLSDEQLERQTRYLEHHPNSRAYYVLLWTSGLEFDDALIAEKTKRRGERIGCERLIEALKHLEGQGPRQDVLELARAYKEALDGQREELESGCEREARDKLFYYSLFWRLQQRLKRRGVGTMIFTEHNPGGEVYKLKNTANTAEVPLRTRNLDVTLCYEVVNNRLCIKFHAPNAGPEDRTMIREEVRLAARRVLGCRLHLVDRGRAGEWMTACQVHHDFSCLDQLERSAEVFAEVGAALPHIANRLCAAGWEPQQP